MAAAASPAAPILMAMTLVIDVAVLVAAWWDARRAAAAPLEAWRRWPTLLAQGVPAAATVELRNPGRRHARILLRETLDPALAIAPARCRIDVAPGEHQLWDIPLSPGRRGAHRSGPLVGRVLGPLGLAWSQRELVPAETVRVYPQVRWEGRVGRLLTLAHRRQLGQVPVTMRGGGGDPYALREYLPGDPLHLIHWKATARHGHPVTREETLEAQGRLVVLLDCGRSMTSTDRGRSKLDHALAAALALARVASSRGDRVTIAAFSNRPLRTVRVSGGSRGLVNAYRQLYDLDASLAEPAYDLLPEIVGPLERRRATVTVLTSVVDLTAAELLTDAMLMLRLRHRLLLVNLEDPELGALAADPADDAEQVFAKVAAMEIVLENRKLAERLRRRGVLTVTAPADRLALATLDAYLELAVARR